MLRNVSVIAIWLALAICASLKVVYAESPSSLRPVDVSISVEATNASGSKMLVYAKDAVDFKTLKAIIDTLPAVDESNTFLTVVGKDEPLYAPRTTGDRQIGINLSSDPVEVFVTDGMPYAVTIRVCEALSATGTFKGVVLKSTHDIAKQFSKEQKAKHARLPGKDPFGG